MRSKAPRSRVLGAVVAVALAAAVGVSLAATGIQGGSGVIHACRKVDNGHIRIVGKPYRCKRHEQALSWNVRGPRGLRGEQGLAGPKGDQGPKGDPGSGIASFDALAGLACGMGSTGGTIAISYDESGVAKITCVGGSGPPPPPVGSVTINEFSTGTEGALNDEFVEIVNAGTSAVDLSGWKLAYRSAAGTSDTSLGTIADGTMLAPGAFYLVAGSGYSGAHPADKTFAIGLATAGGGVGLRDASGALVDSVGWGTATNAFVEGSAAVAPPIEAAPGKSDARHPDGHDTNQNAADFSVAETPTPGAAN
jgi:hypothetical protein